MATLMERARELETKRAQLAELFSEHRNDAGEYEMNSTVLGEVQQRNAELAELQAEYERLLEADRVRKQNEAAIHDLERPQRPPFEGARSEEGRGKGDGELRASLFALPSSHRPALGELFVKSRAYREFSGGKSPAVEVDVDLKTLFQTTAGWAPQSVRTGFVLPNPQERIRVVDLIPKTETSQALVKYMEETTYTNAAAETAEAGTYPESVLALTEQSSTVRKVAVSLPVTDEQFEDEPRARDYVNNRLEFMLRQRLDQQILTGNGTAPNLKGINNVSGINTQAKGTDPGPDAIYKALVLVRKNGFTEPDGLVMHPTNWQDIRLLRTADGVYIWGQPSEQGMERIWGLPVVQTTFQTLGTATLGDFGNFSELALRRGIVFEVTNSHSTFFVEGKLMIRADFRCALIFYRPKAFATTTGL